MHDVADIYSRTPPVTDELRAVLAHSLTQMTVVRPIVSASRRMRGFCSPSSIGRSPHKWVFGTGCHLSG